MKYVFVALLLAATVASDCTADNCLRARVPGRKGGKKKSSASTTSASMVAADCTTVHCLRARAPGPRDQDGSIRPTTSTFSATEPCDMVRISTSEQKAANPSVEPVVTAQLAYDCLNSVPLHKTEALQLVDSMEPYLEWQSDSAWKKNPPAGYLFPPHDIFAFLSSVKTNLLNDKYANEYEFQEDLFQLTVRAHDGHFTFVPDLLGKAFSWRRKMSLVSISEDGTSLPVIKLLEDVFSSPSTASVVTKINGVDASTYLANSAFDDSSTRDADAAYNSMFFTQGSIAQEGVKGYFSSNGGLHFMYPGANTNLTFANGTTFVADNIAHVKGSFDDVTDGTSFYRHFCAVDPGPAQLRLTEERVYPPILEADFVVEPAYPEPLTHTDDMAATTYYLDGEGFEDVAVLTLLIFNSPIDDQLQNLIDEFLATAKAAGKTKLVIDLSHNPGGEIYQGLALFKRFFPTIDPDGYFQMRKNDAFNVISEAIDAKSAQVDLETANTLEWLEALSPLSYRMYLNATNQPFESSEDKFKSNVIDGVDYSPLLRYNLDLYFDASVDNSGGANRNDPTLNFEAENIILLLDGFCSSTCAIFADLMRTQGVKSIAMGGRPQHGPITGVGGTNGGIDFSWSQIYILVLSTLQTGSEAQAAIIKKLTDLPIKRSLRASVNLQNIFYSDHLKDRIPAQYVRSEADCRLFYTLDMLTDVTNLWKAAATAAFKGGKCVAGGFSKDAVAPS